MNMNEDMVVIAEQSEDLCSLIHAGSICQAYTYICATNMSYARALNP